MREKMVEWNDTATFALIWCIQITFHIFYGNKKCTSFNLDSNLVSKSQQKKNAIINKL